MCWGVLGFLFRVSFSVFRIRFWVLGVRYWFFIYRVLGSIHLHHKSESLQGAPFNIILDLSKPLRIFQGRNQIALRKMPKRFSMTI